GPPSPRRKSIPAGTDSLAGRIPRAGATRVPWFALLTSAAVFLAAGSVSWVQYILALGSGEHLSAPSPFGRADSSLADRQAELGAEAVLQEHGIARRQRARRVFGGDLEHEQARTLNRAMQLSAQCPDRRHVGRDAGLRETAGRSHPGEIEPAAGVAPLHAGFTEMPVVDH